MGIYVAPRVGQPPLRAPPRVDSEEEEEDGEIEEAEADADYGQARVVETIHALGSQEFDFPPNDIYIGETVVAPTGVPARHVLSRELARVLRLCMNSSIKRHLQARLDDKLFQYLEKRINGLDPKLLYATAKRMDASARSDGHGLLAILPGIVVGGKTTIAEGFLNTRGALLGASLTDHMFDLQHLCFVSTNSPLGLTIHDICKRIVEVDVSDTRQKFTLVNQKFTNAHGVSIGLYQLKEILLVLSNSGFLKSKQPIGGLGVACLQNEVKKAGGGKTKLVTRLTVNAPDACKYIGSEPNMLSSLIEYYPAGTIDMVRDKMRGILQVFCADIIPKNASKSLSSVQSAEEILRRNQRHRRRAGGAEMPSNRYSTPIDFPQVLKDYSIAETNRRLKEAARQLTPEGQDKFEVNGHNLQEVVEMMRNVGASDANIVKREWVEVKLTRDPRQQFIREELKDVSDFLPWLTHQILYSIQNAGSLGAIHTGSAGVYKDGAAGVREKLCKVDAAMKGVASSLCANDPRAFSNAAFIGSALLCEHLADDAQHIVEVNKDFILKKVQEEIFDSFEPELKSDLMHAFVASCMATFTNIMIREVNRNGGFANSKGLNEGCHITQVGGAVQRTHLINLVKPLIIDLDDGPRDISDDMDAVRDHLGLVYLPPASFYGFAIHHYPTTYLFMRFVDFDRPTEPSVYRVFARPYWVHTWPVFFAWEASDPTPNSYNASGLMSALPSLATSMRREIMDNHTTSDDGTFQAFSVTNGHGSENTNTFLYRMAGDIAMHAAILACHNDEAISMDDKLDPSAARALLARVATEYVNDTDMVVAWQSAIGGKGSREYLRSMQLETVVALAFDAGFISGRGREYGYINMEWNEDGENGYLDSLYEEES